MPEWPGVGRADDHRLLEALRRGGGGDAQAPASLYDAYADRLSDYAYALARDLDAAARAVHDALVAASCNAGRLQEPARLRAWLYALTRFQCAAARGRPTGAAPMTGRVIAVEESADPPLAALVQEALAELGGHEREVLELAVRHGLTTAEIGSVLGLASRQVSARLTRARDHLENAAAALVLARAGRAHCPGLSALVDHGVGAAWQDGPLGTTLRKRLSGHITACEVCREGRGRHVSAERLLDMIPVAFPPLSLRRRVIESALRADGRDGTSAHLDRRGFPVAAGRRARRGRARPRPLRVAPVMLAAACVFGTAGGLALVSGQAPAERLETVRVPPPTAPGDLALGPGENDPPLGDAELPGEVPGEATGGATGGETGDEQGGEQGGEGGEQDAAAPDGSPRSAATAPPHTPPPGRSRPSPTRTARAPRPSLTALCPGDLGTAAGAAITLAARGAVIEWTATTSGGIAVSPRQGRLRAGASGRVTLAVVDPGVPGTGVVTFHSSAGRPSCRVGWEGQEGTGDADPGPAPTSGPTGGPTGAPTDGPGRPGGGPPPAADSAATPSP